MGNVSIVVVCFFVVYCYFLVHERAALNLPYAVQSHRGIFSRSMTRAEGTKESRTRVSERGFFFVHGSFVTVGVRACVPAFDTHNISTCAKLFSGII